VCDTYALAVSVPRQHDALTSAYRSPLSRVKKNVGRSAAALCSLGVGIHRP